jgi:hypothetical protein
VSYSVEVNLLCDVEEFSHMPGHCCRGYIAGEPMDTEAKARKSADEEGAREGWHILPDNKAICPSCQEAREYNRSERNKLA